MRSPSWFSFPPAPICALPCASRGLVVCATGHVHHHDGERRRAVFGWCGRRLRKQLIDAVLRFFYPKGRRPSNSPIALNNATSGRDRHLRDCARTDECSGTALFGVGSAAVWLANPQHPRRRTRCLNVARTRRTGRGVVQCRCRYPQACLLEELTLNELVNFSLLA